jgi:hypothetical protein
MLLLRVLLLSFSAWAFAAHVAVWALGVQLSTRLLAYVVVAGALLLDVYYLRLYRRRRLTAGLLLLAALLELVLHYAPLAWVLLRDETDAASVAGRRMGTQVMLIAVLLAAYLVVVGPRRALAFYSDPLRPSQR